MKFCKICGLEFEDHLVACPECGWVYKASNIVNSDKNNLTLVKEVPDYEYEIIDKGIKLIKLNIKKTAKEILIPKTIEGFPVTELGKGLFSGWDKSNSNDLSI